MRNKIAFNVGASVGTSLDELSKYDIIYAFEPMPFSFKKLVDVCKSLDNVKYYQLAISEEDGYSSFNCHSHYEYSSLLKIKKDGEFVTKCNQIDPGFDYIQDIIVVETKRLDTFLLENKIEYIDFLKIDTQGSDLSVVMSLGECINKVNLIELEVQNIPLYEDSPSKEETIEYLKIKGFELIDEVWNNDDLVGYEQRLTFKRSIEDIKEFREDLILSSGSFFDESIPVIGIPIVNGFHWLLRLIDSIDFPVKNLLIINNNGKGEIDDDLNKLNKLSHPFVDKIHILNMPSNLGVATSWNLIIKSFIMEPYWVVSNNDIAFQPGLLKELFEKSNDSSIDMIHGSRGDFNDGSYDLFLIKESIIKKIGLFDENCYPAYCEDVDYIMRITRWNWNNPNDVIKRIPFLDTPYYHGDKLSSEDNYYEGGSQTKKQNTELNHKLDMINLINFEYMTQKWGPGWRMTNPCVSPMGIDGLPITYTSFDLEFVRKKYLGF